MLDKRILPFIFIYALIFGGLVIMETLMTSLILEKEGVERLTLYYGLSAIAVFVTLSFYRTIAHKSCVRKTLQGMLAISGLSFAVSFALVKLGVDVPYGILFVIREVSFLMILMHFPNFAQSYFSIDDYKKFSVPLLAGGRIGAVIGSFIFEAWINYFGLFNSIILYLIAISLSILILYKFICGSSQYPSSEGNRESTKEIAQSSPLFTHLIITGFIYILARWLMNYQYNTIFANEFPNATELTLFINRYSQISLTLLTILQLFFIGKFIQWLGVGKSFLLYHIVFVLASLLLIFDRSLHSALIARFVENEFRNTFRNPLYQNLTALFTGAQRIVVRSFLQGIVNPTGIFCASILLRASPLLTNLALCSQACFLMALGSLFSGFRVHTSVTGQESKVKSTVPSNKL